MEDSSNNGERRAKSVGEGGSTKSSSSKSNPTPALESPPTQVMERPPEPSSSSGYRIPSHVFARNKSNNPNNQEWSIASNDSLFSIHTGNMSFTRDQFGYGDLMKSGELGMYGDMGKLTDLHKSGELPPPSPKLPPPSPKFVPKQKEQKPPTVPTNQIYKSGEQIIAEHFNPSPTGNNNSPNEAGKVNGVAENKSDSLAPDLVAGVVKDDPKPSDASLSHQSDTSAQSFAFPMLEEVEREKSIVSGNSKATQQRKNSSNNNDEQPTTPTSAPPKGNSGSIFSCFSCCSRC